MVHAGCVFYCWHSPSRTWMSGSFASVRWNACVHRLNLSFYSHPKEFWRNGVRTHVNSEVKIPFTGKILPRGVSNPWCCIKQDSEPNTLLTSYSGPSWSFDLSLPLPPGKSCALRDQLEGQVVRRLSGKQETSWHKYFMLPCALCSVYATHGRNGSGHARRLHLTLSLLKNEYT